MPSHTRPTDARRSRRRPGTPTCSVAASLIGLLLAGPALAGQWNLIGSRAQGMGGAGVATTTDSTGFFVFLGLATLFLLA